MRPYSLPASSGNFEPLAGHDNAAFPRQAACLSPAEHLAPTDNTVRHCGYRITPATVSRGTNRKKPVNRLKDDFRLFTSGFFARPEERLPDFPPNSPETGIFNPVSMRSSGLFSPLSSIPFRHFRRQRPETPSRFFRHARPAFIFPPRHRPFASIAGYTDRNAPDRKIRPVRPLIFQPDCPS